MSVNRTKVVTVRFTEAELSGLKFLAKQEGVKVSEYIRSRLYTQNARNPVLHQIVHVKNSLDKVTSEIYDLKKWLDKFRDNFIADHSSKS